jgi:hypothetical protein
VKSLFYSIDKHKQPQGDFMDLSKMRYIIETHRPLRLTSSLPFAVEENGELKVRWFVYEMETKNNVNEILVQRIYTMDQSGRVAIKLNPNLKLHAPAMATEDDFADVDESFDEVAYYENFQIAFNTNDHKKLKDILHKIESKSSLMIYDAIINYKSSNER